MALSESQIATAPVGEGSIDEFASSDKTFGLSATDVTDDQYLVVRGWFIAANPLAVVDRFFFIIDGQHAHLVDYGVARRDVMTHLRNTRLLHCGFDVRFPVATLTPGPHVLTCLGLIGNQAHALPTTRSFTVLATPAIVERPKLNALLPGRIRRADGNNKEAGRDGRGRSSFAKGASLVVTGWQAASESGDIADSLSVILVGQTNCYSLATVSRAEPEAGVIFGAAAIACGFQAYADCRTIIPGTYQISIEVEAMNHRRCVGRDVWVEIMGDNNTWFPTAVPIYRDSLESKFAPALPTTIRQDETLVLSGSVRSAERLAGIYVRIDQETSYALTHVAAPELAEAGGESKHFTATFGGLISIQLPIGEHSVEILALDRSNSGAWLLLRQTLTVVESAIEETVHFIDRSQEYSTNNGNQIVEDIDELASSNVK